MIPIDALQKTARIGLAFLALALLVPACDDAFGPLPWLDLPDTVALYSLARAEHVGKPGAYDFMVRIPVVVEAQKHANVFDFDVAISESDTGFILIPAGVFQNFQIRPGVMAVPGETFESLLRAPRDGYITEEVLPLELGVVYAVRTRRDGRGCNYYGKFEVLSAGEDGVVRLRALSNNRNCNNRDLVSPDSD